MQMHQRFPQGSLLEPALNPVIPKEEKYLLFHFQGYPRQPILRVAAAVAPFFSSFQIFTFSWNDF